MKNVLRIFFALLKFESDVYIFFSISNVPFFFYIFAMCEQSAKELDYFLSSVCFANRWMHLPSC